MDISAELREWAASAQPREASDIELDDAAMEPMSRHGLEGEEFDITPSVLRRERAHINDSLKDDPHYAGRVRELHSSSSEEFDRECSASEEEKEEKLEYVVKADPAIAKELNAYQNVKERDISIMREITADNVEKESKQRKAVKQQRQLWDQTLDMRMHLQRPLHAVNGLPDAADPLWDDIRPLFEPITQELSSLLHSFPEFAVKGAATKTSLSALWESLDANNTQIMMTSLKTIDKWSMNTKIASGKIKSNQLKALDQKVSTQIQNVTSDMERLRKRTQVPRLTYSKLSTLKRRMEADPEMFDDTDFYHKLVKDLVVKGSTGSDLNDMAMYRTKQAKLNKGPRMKKSKGRRINYDVEEKLMNFMAPVPITCDESLRENLFLALFR